jgi:hypothetical protein
MVRITETSTISDYEKSKLKKEEDFLLVGKSDKSIHIVSKGEKISIKELAEATRTGTTVGYLSIPTLEGVPFVLQYGNVSVAPDSTVTVTLPTPFTNRCFQTQVSLKNDTTDASTVKSSLGTTTDLTITRIGGTLANVVHWIAIGF